MAEEGPAPQHDPQDLVNTLFPPPPAFYQQFTTANLTRYASLAGPSGTSKNRALPTSTPEHVANGERSSKEEEEYQTLRSTLEPPRADWVEEDGRWKCFGEVYTTDMVIPSATEIGLPPWVDPDQPPQVSLPPILHSFLHTLLLLIDTLTQAALNPMELAQRQISHVGDPYIQHMSNLAATLMVSSNQLRGIQAEATLVMLMEKQVESRKAQTAALRKKCRSIASSIYRLREAARKSSADKDETMDSEPRGAGGDFVKM